MQHVKSLYKLLTPIKPIASSLGKAFEASGKALIGSNALEYFDYPKTAYLDLDSKANTDPVYFQALRKEGESSSSTLPTSISTGDNFVAYTASLNESSLSSSSSSAIWYGARLGNDVTIGSNVNILDKTVVENKVKISSDVLIGAKSLLKEGSSVGKDSYIGNGAIIEEGVSLPENSFVPDAAVVSSSNASEFKFPEEKKDYFAEMKIFYTEQAFDMHKRENDRSWNEILTDVDLCENEGMRVLFETKASINKGLVF
eukprot:maker-scaffold_12-snap-gene-5.19-mRNA-1 protein AED:0.00 eAED:0.00 QI:102/1/1/1/1/1/2/130/256